MQRDGSFDPTGRPGAERRMLCTECLHLGVPDTLLDGSDRVELLLWACLALPGLLCCAWRHLNRRKLCPQCGSGALMRETRASALRGVPQAPAAAGPRVRCAGPGLFWPAELATPRARLRAGGLAATACAFALLAWLFAGLDARSAAHAREAASLAWLAYALWMGWQLHAILRARARWDACQAWDERGRRLRIEML